MAGALGLGGGLVVVPGLVFFFQLAAVIPSEAVMHAAIASSLAVVFFTSLASLNSHRKHSEVLWSVFYKLAPGLALGACLGGFCSSLISTANLKLIFIVFLLGVALKMCLDVHRQQKVLVLPSWLYYVLSVLIGSLAALVGVGGGVLLIPLLTYMGIPSRQIAPLSNLGGLIVAFVGMSSLMIGGLRAMADIHYTLGFVYWPAVLGITIPSSLMAPFGAKLNYVLPMHYLKYGFIVILILTAIKMLI